MFDHQATAFLMGSYDAAVWCNSRSDSIYPSPDVNPWFPNKIYIYIYIYTHTWMIIYTNIYYIHIQNIYVHIYQHPCEYMRWWAHTHLCIYVCVCICVLKWIDPQRDLYFLKIYLFRSYLRVCFQLVAFVRTYATQGHVNWGLNEIWTNSCLIGFSFVWFYIEVTRPFFRVSLVCTFYH